MVGKYQFLFWILIQFPHLKCISKIIGSSMLFWILIQLVILILFQGFLLNSIFVNFDLIGITVLIMQVKKLIMQVKKSTFWMTRLGC